MLLSQPPLKDYKKDIRIIAESLRKKENFSISKFCDGELSIILNQAIDNKEFSFDPRDKRDQDSRRLLINAFQYKNPRYYVGITCVKVFGLQTHRQMKMISGQDESNLTWADIWVNSNYPYYVKNILPIFKERKTILVCNERGHTDALPFVPSKIFTVKNSAFRENIDIVDKIKEYIDSNGVSGCIFLFCCGPFGNILCHQLTEHNENNTYLDIGSTLNPYLKSEGFKRDYYVGSNFFSNLSGVWDNG
jgi:hypothetical protein